MNPATAALLILTGIALASALCRRSLVTGVMGKALGAIVAVVAASKLLEFSGIWYSPIDEVFFAAKLSNIRDALPNRMAPNTTLNFLLAGLSVLLLDLRGRRSVSQALAIVVAFGALLPITGYAYGVRSFSGLAAFIPMALHTAVTFLVLAAGIFFAVPHAPLAEPFVTNDSRGVLARILFPLVVLLTLFFGWVCVWGVRHQHYDSEFGTALYAITLCVLFAVVVRWTVSAVGKLEAERAEVNARLRALNRRKDEMIAVVSHDLCSPLTGFRMVIDLLREKREEPTEELLDIMDHSARRMVSMVRGLLDISKLQADKVELELEDVQVSEVIRQAMEPLAINANAKRIQLQLHVAPGEPTFRADRLRLSQVFSNLLTNAVKFTPNGGAVDVAVERAGEGLEISVRDTGLGIPQEELPHIFDKYRQTTTKATSGESGTGLGLSIVRELVLLHAGQITVASELGRGSVFTVVLPASPDRHAR
ncbi:MAG TPA: HAMP domain-containing sensor histidine kinase [Chthoniobacterales bacterium]|nr:HAMP domain-containing sensor histidine kinase [Chthoniobacterales bacterium]